MGHLNYYHYCCRFTETYSSLNFEHGQRADAKSFTHSKGFTRTLETLLLNLSAMKIQKMKKII